VTDTDSQDPERRAEDRRGGDRRRFRSNPGRRDPTSRPRRRQDRARPRFFVPVVLLVTFAVIGLSYRAVYVSPRRGARAEAAEVGLVASKLLNDVSLPLQAVPGFGPPGEGDPAQGVELGPQQTTLLQELSNRLQLASEAAPAEVTPYIWQGRIRLALGDERGARMAWQQVLALGDVTQKGPARVGIAVIEIRTGLRAASEQDRAFAMESALHTLEPLDKASLVWPHALVEEAVARLALDQEDALEGAMKELANTQGPIAKAALPMLSARHSGEEPLSVTLERLLDRSEDPE